MLRDFPNLVPRPSSGHHFLWEGKRVWCVTMEPWILICGSAKQSDCLIVHNNEKFTWCHERWQCDGGCCALLGLICCYTAFDRVVRYSAHSIGYQTLHAEQTGAMQTFLGGTCSYYCQQTAGTQYALQLSLWSSTTLKRK